MIDIRDHGAVGDGRTVNTERIQAAIDAAAERRESILIAGGTFVTGTLHLKGVSIHLEAGAVLKGSDHMEDYPVQEYVHNEMGHLRALLIDMDSENVSIDGDGTIDLTGTAFYDTEQFNVPKSRVPFTEEQKKECTYFIGQRPNQCIFFYNCRHIVLRGIRIIDAPCWTMTFSDCEDVKVLGLTISTSPNVPNNDGIHVCSSRGILISDCHITSGDDCIAISNITNWERPCEDIVITNCVLQSCSKAIVVGYIYSWVRNVLITNCIIKESNRGLTFMCNDTGATIENVRVKNMIIDTRIRAGNWWGNGEPIFLMATKQDQLIKPEQNPHRKTEFAIRNVKLEGITCMGENAMGIVSTDGNIREVELKDIDYVRKPSANLPLKGSCFDLSPGSRRVEIPGSCGLFVSSDADVRLENINTREWTVLRG